jgi:hypothetical protein
MAVGSRHRESLLREDSYKDRHPVMEVFVPCDQGVVLDVLKGDTHGDMFSWVEAIEVLDCRYDRIRGIVGKDVNTQG